MSLPLEVLSDDELVDIFHAAGLYVPGEVIGGHAVLAVRDGGPVFVDFCPYHGENHPAVGCWACKNERRHEP